LKAIILAAGEGRRLRPLTDNKPKCMVELFGKNLLDWKVNLLKKYGISDIIVITGYMSEKINVKQVRFYKNNLFETTNMVETLFCAREEFDDSLLIIYGDIIFEEKILEKILKSEDEISVVIDQNWKEYWKIRFNNPLDDAESLSLDKNGFIQNIGQKVNDIDDISGQYIGLIKFSKNSIQKILMFYDKMKEESKNGKNPLNVNLSFEKSYMTDFLQAMINSGFKIKGIPVKNGWLELDSINDYETYQKLFNSGQIQKFFNLN
jgi:L-glutamine-phosphate cytidylyltransferase